MADNDDTQPESDAVDASHNAPILDTEVNPEGQFLSLSPAALLGLSSPKALRVISYIPGKPVSVLIDSGSTHNIIQPRMASFLRIPVTNITKFPVTVGNGDNMHYNGSCPEVKLTLSDHLFTIPLFVLPIEGADIVLGMAWLGSLGPATVDFSISSLAFHQDDHIVKLTREPIITQASPTTVLYVLQKQAVSSMHTLTFHHQFSLKPSPTLTHPNPKIHALLAAFTHVFDTPTTLPPKRAHDHHIHLQ